MRKSTKKSILMSAVLTLSIACITGCGKIDLSKEEEGLFVELAVDAIVNHDKNYIIKLVDREPEPETTTVWISDNSGETPTKPDGSPADNAGQQGGEQQGVQGNTVSVNEAFSLSGFTVETNGYEVASSYPGDDNPGFSMVATKENQLLVLKFNVTNSSGAQASLNMPGMEYSYRCEINGSTRVNAQVTALLDGFNTWNNTLEAGETKEMVLVFQVNKDVAAGINSINLHITNGNGTRTAAIK